MKKILMLNTLPVHNFGSSNALKKTAGNQTLSNTLKGLSENNFSVVVLTFADISKTSTPYPNITIKRSKFYKIFHKLFQIKNKISKLILNRNINNSSNTGTPNNGVRGSQFLFYFWLTFGFLEGLYIAIKDKSDLIYGYEIYSTKPAKLISKFKKVPMVSRFQGTELSFYLDNPELFEKHKAYIKGSGVDADLIIMANDGTEGDAILQNLGVDPQKIRFWVNGLNDKMNYLNYNKDSKYRQIMSLPKDSLIICTANRFVDWKRIDRIIDVIRTLSKANNSIYLIAVGDGPERPFLEELVKNYNLEGNVIFTGPLEHEETIYHIANADIYITLNDGGNLGNSILEALTLGVPVCTIRNDSAEKVLIDNYNSILFDSLDITSISDKILEILQNKDKLNRISKNARKYAENELLSWSERMNKESQEIMSLLEEDLNEILV